jgi:alkylation response protein AidB-like acyl-CoA dehydrogenase
MNFGNPELAKRITQEVFSGKKLCALAITEAFAGSDVAGLRCHAKKVDGGYIVTGTYVNSQDIFPPNLVDWFLTERSGSPTELSLITSRLDAAQIKEGSASL